MDQFSTILFDSMFNSSEQIISNFWDYYVERIEANILIEKLKKKNKIIFLIGGRGTGKTTILKFISKKLSREYSEIVNINAFQSDNSEFELLDDNKLYIIDNAEFLSNNFIEKIYRFEKSKSSSQVIISGNKQLDHFKNAPIIKIGNLNQNQLKSFIEKRLHAFDNPTVNLVYDIFIKNNGGLLNKSVSPRELLFSFNSIYNEILNVSIQNNINTPQKTTERNSLSAFNVFSIAFSIFLFILSQKSGDISTDELKRDIKSSTESILDNIKSSNIDCGYYQTSRNVNIRDIPTGNNSSIKFTINKGDIVRLIERRENWWFIQYDKFDTGEVIEGWVYSNFLQPMTNIE